MPVDISQEHFDELVSDALDELPPQIEAMLENVAILVADGHVGGPLGLYQGIPRTARGQYGFMEMPDRVTIFRVPLCAHARDEEHLKREVRVTVVHEIGHHIGLSDTRLDELGYG